MSATVETIKERLSIAEVVGSYIKLEKAGVNLKARCPFHHEKTPSFVVSLARNSYYCFGCNAKGDIFSFVEAFEGVDFKGALKVLADRAGVEIVHERQEVRSERERAFEILDIATNYFEDMLIRTSDVLTYLTNRGASLESLKKFRVGFARDDWHSVELFLKEKGYREKELLESGLCIAGPKGMYDRFRSRIMFPLSDSSGRIIAFSGRIFETDKSGTKSTEAKYVNSPETTLFSKSHVLYGYDKGKLPIRKWNFSIIVEGQMDLLMSHQAGYGNTVAPSGTALTAQQLMLLKRLSSNVVLAFDGDAAGLKATERSAHIALGMGMDVKVATLPADSDPADLIAKDPNAWKEAIKNAQHVVDFYLRELESKKTDVRTFRRTTAATVLPFVKRIPNKIDQAHFISKIALRLGIDEESVREELKRVKMDASSEGVRANENGGGEKTTGASVDRMIWNVLLWQRSLKKPLINLLGVEKRLKDIYGRESMERELEAAAADVDNRIFEAEEEWGEVADVALRVEDMLTRLSRRVLKERYSAAQNELRMAEESEDTERIEKALAACDKISRKLFEKVSR
ncbi:MAG: DNA primase [Parcubacteria group bacterium Gr01-1014_48]|nr:MAG: DNA primase [Parcubacteria group bacterium Greene0416_14]TSC74250.1 MAG: DNA primase [Parcubacteria group bacterium Gr01-1014_48]TSD01509.1 MAG: DNA primase [Parcubacteria group bacterium Greene1014_15]TSD08331.1 MAG: DNA primase [Parcubacteria group bacterium Greene0714_4]